MNASQQSRKNAARMNELLRSRRSSQSRTSVAGIPPAARAGNRELRRLYAETLGHRQWVTDQDGRHHYTADEMLEELDRQEREDRGG